MKKKIIIAAITAVLVLAAAFCLWKFVFSSGGSTTPGAEDTQVQVASVASITGIGPGASSETRFSGVIEPQKTLDIKKDSEKKISTLYVSEGDLVKKGDKLFKYDTDDIALKLEQSKLEVETISNKISTLYNQIEDLKKERDNAEESEQLNYTLQIQSLELDVKTEEYNKTLKANETAKIEKSLSSTVVKSQIQGIVKSINSTGEMASDGSEKPYISILSTGNYRVKCTISELHMDAISQGQSMVIRSRTNQDQTWTGQIESIDRENQVQDQQNGGMVYMGGGGGEGTGTVASKYNFYVSLEDFEGLILGQHVFAELDFGTDEKKEGLWMPSMYIVSEDGKSFVWVRNDKEKLEKRQIVLGEQDATTDTYEITDGLAITDYIAFPQENLSNGMATVVGVPGMNIPSSPDGGNVAVPEGGEIAPEGGEAVPEGGEAVPEGGEAVPEGGEAVPEGGAIGGADGEGGKAAPEGGAVIGGADGDGGKAAPEGQAPADEANRTAGSGGRI